jgi:hypothetical protein
MEESMLLTLSRPRRAHFRRAPLLGTEGVDLPDVGLVLRDVPHPAPPVEAGPEQPVEDIVEVWGMQSFPASDPPSNW